MLLPLPPVQINVLCFISLSLALSVSSACILSNKLIRECQNSHIPLCDCIMTRHFQLRSKENIASAPLLIQRRYHFGSLRSTMYLHKSARCFSCRTISALLHQQIRPCSASLGGNALARYVLPAEYQPGLQERLGTFNSHYVGSHRPQWHYDYTRTSPGRPAHTNCE